MTKLTTIHPTAADIAPQDVQDTLAEFLRLNLAEGDASPATLAAVHSSLNVYTLFCEAHRLEPTRATPDDIRQYRAWLIGNGNAPATVGQRLWAVRKLFAAAVWRGWRPDNPAIGIKPPKDTTNEADKVKFLPYAGFKCLVNTPDTKTLKGRRDKAIMVMLALHGLRVFEVSTLATGDIEGDKITVTGKGKKKRSIYLTDATRPIIARWLKDRRPIARRTNTAAVFVALGNRSYGRAMTTRGIRHMVDSYLTSCGLKAEGISCHSLRHSHATWATYNGANARTLQYNMGHANSATTDKYKGVVDRIKDNPALALSDLLE